MDEYEICGYRVLGRSSAGVGTAIMFPELDICFDVAQGASKYFMSVGNFLISHGHMDHAAGIPFIASQKAMNHQKTPKFYMPEIMIEPMHEIMQLWMKIENHEYTYEFIPIKEGEKYPLKGPNFFKVFPTPHRIQSFGYTIFRERRKLKESFLDLPRQEIISRREKGVELYDYDEEPLITFTGDTKIEFLNSCPWVKDSKILFVETTYLDDKKSVEEARKWGHIHLDEVIPNLDAINSEMIVFIHFSRRYSHADVKRILEEKIPPQFKSRVMMLVK